MGGEETVKRKMDQPKSLQILDYLKKINKFMIYNELQKYN